MWPKLKTGKNFEIQVSCKDELQTAGWGKIVSHHKEIFYLMMEAVIYQSERKDDFSYF